MKKPIRRSSDSVIWEVLPTLADSLPGIASSDRFSPCGAALTLQRRYRSGFTPDYLVQQTQPYAMSATNGYSIVGRIIAQRAKEVNEKLCVIVA